MQTYKIYLYKQDALKSRLSCTFGIVPGVELKQLDRVVGETVHVDSVLQNNNDPGEHIIISDVKAGT